MHNLYPDIDMFSDEKAAGRNKAVFQSGDLVAVRFASKEIREKWKGMPRYLWMIGRVQAVRDGGNTIEILMNGEQEESVFSDTRRSAQYTLRGHPIRTLSSRKIRRMAKEDPDAGWDIQSDGYWSAEEIDIVANDKQIKRAPIDVGDMSWVEEMSLPNTRIQPKILSEGAYSASPVLGQWIQISSGKYKGWSGFFIGFSLGVDDPQHGCVGHDGVPVYWFYLDPKSHNIEIDNPDMSLYCTFLQQKILDKRHPDVITRLKKWFKQLGTGERQASYQNFVQARKRLKRFKG